MNPLLFDFPSEFYTDRLFIRMPKPGDGKVVYDAIQASIQELKPGWCLHKRANRARNRRKY